MKHTTTTSILSGTNESPIVGQFIVGVGRDFIVRGVVTGVSVLTNKTTRKSGLVTGVAAAQVNASVTFNPGDFFEVTLAAPWIMQTADGPVIEVECKRCGWSFPNRALVNGLCKVCIDKPQRI